MTDLKRVSESDIRCRIEEIDSLFKSAVGWGSWMVEVGNERQSLTRELRSRGVDIEDRFVPQTAGGHSVD